MMRRMSAVMLSACAILAAAGRGETTLDPGRRLERFELNLATAEGRAHLAGGARVEAFFSAAQPVALLRR